MQPEEMFNELDARQTQEADEQKHAEVVGAIQNDTEKTTESIHDLLLATLVAKDPRIVDVAKNLQDLINQIAKATSNVKGANFKPLATNLNKLNDALKSVPKEIEAANRDIPDPTPAIESLQKTLDGKNFSHNVSVSAPSLNLTPLEKLLKDVKEALSRDVKPDNTKVEKNLDGVKAAVNSVQKAITAIRFPVSNYVLPFRNEAGKADQIQLTSTGKLPVDATFSTGDIEIGAVEIKDGASDNRATVSAGGAIKVDGSAVTQPVSLSGTVAVTQSGTWDEVGINDSGNSITVDAPVATPVFVRLSDGSSAIATLPVSLASVPSHAVTNAGTFAVQTTSAITGIGHGVKTVTTAGTDVALSTTQACKRVTIQAQTDNTNAIAVGATGVDATVATGTGVLLFPGDVFELEIDDLADVFIDSLVNGEGVRYTYFT